MSRRGMAPAGLLRVLAPGDPFRDSRSPFSSIYSWGRNGAGRYPAVGGRQSLCGSRPHTRVSLRHLPRGISRARSTGKEEWFNYLFKLRGMARRIRWTEGSFCSEPITAVEAMAKGLGEDGVIGGICDGFTTGRPPGINGHREGLPALPPSPRYERLVHLQVGGSLLSVLGSSFRLGPLSLVVYAAHGPVCAGSPQLRISCARVPRRLRIRTFAARRNVDSKPLPTSDGSNPSSFRPTRFKTSPDERRVVWGKSGRASGRSHRHRADALLHRPAQGFEGPRSRKTPAEKSATGQAVGFEEGCVTLLWRLRVIGACNAMGPLLHPCPLLGHWFDEAEGCTWALPAQPSEYSRLVEVAELGPSRTGRASDGSDHAYRSDAHGRSRGWVGWYAQCGRPEPRYPRPLEGAGYLELERPSRKHQLLRAEGHSTFAHRLSGHGGRATETRGLAFTCRQPGRLAHHKLVCLGQPAYDARAEEAQGRPRSLGPASSDGLDTVSRQQVCRRLVATRPSRRLADPAGAAAFRSGWNASPSGLIPLSPSRGASSATPTGRSPALPTGRPHQRNCAQAPIDEGSGSFADSGLASTALACRRVAPRDEIGAARSAPGGGVDGLATHQTEVEPAAPRSEPRVGPRAARRMSLADQAVRRIGTLPPSSGLGRSASLLSDFAWSERTTSTRNSQWKTWVSFCDAEGRPILPVTEAHFVAFIGWLTLEREAGRRSVSSASIPQYLSAVRQMHQTTLGYAIPSFPLVAALIRGYSRWEEANFPKTEVRCGIPATIIQRIWGLGMSTSSPATLRDAASCVFAYCLHGVRESSVLSILPLNVSLDGNEMTARLSLVKGKQASQAALVRYERWNNLPSPVDLWLRWQHARGNHSRFFGLDGEQEYNPNAGGGLTRSLQNCPEILQITAPPGGKFTSHSLRIGAHTEQVLLGIPLEVRLSRFGWGPRSDKMASTYFDRTIRVTAASFWLFGPANASWGPAVPVSSPSL